MPKTNPGPDPNPWDDPEVQAWAKRVREELVPMIQGSAISMSILPEDPEKVDVKMAVEVGLSLLLDKPLILMVRPGTIVPIRLARAADEIIEADLANPDGLAERVHDAMIRVLGEEDEDRVVE